MNETILTLLTIAISSTISGIFIGLGIAVGIFHALKRQVPRWIKEVIDAMRKETAIRHALESRVKYR